MQLSIQRLLTFIKGQVTESVQPGVEDGHIGEVVAREHPEDRGFEPANPNESRVSQAVRLHQRAHRHQKRGATC